MMMRFSIPRHAAGALLFKMKPSTLLILQVGSAVNADIAGTRREGRMLGIGRCVNQPHRKRS